MLYCFKAVIRKQHIDEVIKFVSHRINRIERKDWGSTTGTGKCGLGSERELESWLYHFLVQWPIANCLTV